VSFVPVFKNKAGEVCFREIKKEVIVVAEHVIVYVPLIS
jgi:hypothetical protein